jgi:hypothetical protein
MKVMALVFTLDELEDLECMCIDSGAVNDNPVASDMWAGRFRAIIDGIKSGELKMEGMG